MSKENKDGGGKHLTPAQEKILKDHAAGHAPLGPGGKKHEAGHGPHASKPAGGKTFTRQKKI